MEGTKKIVRLEVANVKRVRAAHIEPDGRLVVVGGKNGAGKSSVLDAIMYALGGKGAVCAEPVRQGEESGSVMVDLGDMVVTRKFSADGGQTLVVETKQGARFPSPQAKLDDLVGRLSFDPLEFSREDRGDQVDILLHALGVDFAGLDAQRLALFEERTVANRELAAMRALLTTLPENYEDAPAEKLSIDDAAQALEDGLATLEANRKRREGLAKKQNELSDAIRRRDAFTEAVLEVEREIEDLRDKLGVARHNVEGAELVIDKARAAALEEQAVVDALQPIEIGPLRAALGQVGEMNLKLAANQERAKLEEKIEAKRQEAATLTGSIDAVDLAKQEALRTANFPVEGLGLDEEHGVTLNGVPLDQASSAERLRLSVAIGLALNPKLRVLLIRDGSLLDSDSLALIASMAEERDAQLWIERVEEGGATFVIEDGFASYPEKAPTF